MRFAPVLPLLFLTACPTPAPDDAGTMDASVDAPVDTPPDTVAPRTHEEIPAPEALRVGIARARIPAPVGIGTMGFGALGADPNPSPFAELFPGTTRAHGQLDFRAVAISRGAANEMVLVRMDTVGVFQQLREAVLDELEARIGRRLDDALILAGNHTHSGPGRLLLTTGALTQLGDEFLPEFYDRVVQTLADVIESALEDAAPAELGFGVAHSSDAHGDRRCENDPLPQLQELGDMPFVVVRRAGRVDAIVASYAYHGTVLDLAQHTLSGDMGHVVEERVEERFDHPVSVLFFNSWGADMAPGNPLADPGAVGADLPEGYERMMLLGDVVAGALEAELPGVAYTSEPTVRLRTYRVGIDRVAIGYEDRYFNYPNGGAFCGVGSDGACDSIMPDEGLTRRCIRLDADDGLPHQTLLSAGQLGDVIVVTAPGEWSTALANGVLDRVRASGATSTMLIGYANDYTGYSVGEMDWFQGGYEASGALWGPRQGDYLAARMFEAFETFRDAWAQPPWAEPDTLPAFSGYTYEPYVPETPTMAPGTILTNVRASYGPTDVAAFTVAGSDPWLGVPIATLERDDGAGTFAPVVRPNGEPVDTTGYEGWADLVVTPSYADAERADRSFAWTIQFPIETRAGAAVPLSGTYRFSVRVPTTAGDTTVSTAPFTVP